MAMVLALAVAMALEIVPASYFTLGHPGTWDLPALSFVENRAKARPMKIGTDKYEQLVNRWVIAQFLVRGFNKKKMLCDISCEDLEVPIIKPCTTS